MNIENIIEHKSVVKYIISRNLLSQYKKAKKILKRGEEKMIDFKLRKPKKDKIYYFRINRQFRAFCYFENKRLIVFKISDHQN